MTNSSGVSRPYESAFATRDALFGMGSGSFDIAFYIANRPPMEPYCSLQTLQPVQVHELASIAKNSSNHWRKAFNVLAKCLFELRSSGHAAMSGSSLIRPVDTWQQYREAVLLQAHSCEALIFSRPALSIIEKGKAGPVHIIAGKTYAENLALDIPFHWLDRYFAINRHYRLVVSPYLDYRQLSNERISRLIYLIRALATNSPL